MAVREYLTYCRSIFWVVLVQLPSPTQCRGKKTDKTASVEGQPGQEELGNQKTAITPKTDEKELSCQVTQYERLKKPNVTKTGKTKQKTIEQSMTDSERSDLRKLSPVARTPVTSNPATPTKGVSTANEIKSVIGDTPTKDVITAKSIGNNSDVSVTGSNQITGSSGTENSKTKRGRRAARKRRRSEQGAVVTIKKDPEEELLKATKEESNDDVFVPKLCYCGGGTNGPLKDEEQLFNAQIEYKMEPTKVDVDYYPYQPLNLLTPVEGASELCRDACDVTSAPAGSSNYLTPLQTVLDVQRCAAQQAEVIDKMIKYGDYGENE